MGETLPPLRVKEVPDGDPNAIPVYTIEISGATVQRISATGVRILIDSGAGASGAPTGGEYITYAANATLSAERVLAASDNITIVSSGTSVLISATTSLITYPIVASSGGTGVGTLGSNQLLIGAGTAAITVLALLNSGELVVGSATTVRPQILGSGSQGQVLVADSSQRLGIAWVNSASVQGAAGIVYAQTGDTFLVYSASTSLTSERVIAASDNITIVSSGTSFLISATTGAGGASTIVTRIPMALLTVEVNSSNAFWTAQTDTTRMDKAYINHIDSGRSVSTWWCDVPSNVNATPAWGLEIVSEAASLGATGGLVVLNVDGMSVAAGESANTLAASTVQLVAAGSFLMNTAGILTISTMTATNFDAALATSGTDYMKIKVTRVGQSDTFNSDWYVYGIRMKCTVDT